MSEGKKLFSEFDLIDVLKSREQRMFEEINSIDGNRLLNSSIEDLCSYFINKYMIEVPQLKEDKINAGQHEEKVKVSKDRRPSIEDQSEPFYVLRTVINYYIPFEGDPELFQYRPLTHSLNPPRGIVSENELILSYIRTDHDVAAVKSAFERDLAQIRQYLEWAKSSVSEFNASLNYKVRNRIETRRQKLLQDQGLVAALGFPLRERKNASNTYTVPMARKKIKPQMPKASTAPFVPEPVLDFNDYEHILSVICNMVLVMERSPKAFRGMNEEDLRQHFLVQLNGQYEGQATGETFNFEGKTDILIREGDRNIFIAECKFWHGPQSLKDAIDQLLNYASWRDTKTALLIFNRSKDFSNVVAQIPTVVKAHPNFKHELPYNSERGFRFVLHHRDDINRELILTVLAFEVPA